MQQGQYYIVHVCLPDTVVITGPLSGLCVLYSQYCRTAPACSCTTAQTVGVQVATVVLHAAETWLVVCVVSKKIFYRTLSHVCSKCTGWWNVLSRLLSSMAVLCPKTRGVSSPQAGGCAAVFLTQQLYWPCSVFSTTEGKARPARSFESATLSYISKQP